MMLAVGLPLGIIAGWLRRGRLENLARLDRRAVFIVLAAVLIRLGLDRAAAAAPSPALLLAAEGVLYLGVFLAVAMHRRLPGAWLVGVGGGLNLLAIALHGGRMPVWTAVAGRVAAGARAQLQAGTLLAHVAMAVPRGLGWLGDVIGLPPPLPAEVLSVGDLVLICGVAVFLASAMTAPADRVSARRPGGGA